MEQINYLTDKYGLVILGLIVLCALLYKKYKTQRYFKHIEKKRKSKDSK